VLLFLPPPEFSNSCDPSFALAPHIIERYCITSTSLSIAHDGGFAIAVAAIEVSTASNKV